MHTIKQRSRMLRAVAWGTGLAVLWLVLALARPSLIFHLAPLLVTAAPPVLLSLDDDSRASRAEVGIVATIGAALALLTTAILATVGRLDAPGFGPFPDALVEALLLVGLGVVIGLAVASWRLGWWPLGSQSDSQD